MNQSRRSFFKRCAAAVATLALAQEIAFGRQLATELPKLDLDEMFRLIYQIKLKREQYRDEPPTLLMDRQSAKSFQDAFQKMMIRYWKEKANHHANQRNDTQ